jgi:hypothetical protein
VEQPLAGRIGVGQRLLPRDGGSPELDGATVRAAQDRRLGGPLHHRDPVLAVHGLEAGQLVPEVQRTLVVAAGLGERIDAFGGGAGGDQRRDRPAGIPSLGPVVGELRGVDRHAAHLASFGQRPGERGVEPLPLAGEEFRVDDFLQEGMAERVTADPVGPAIGIGHDPAGNELTEAAGDVAVGQVEDRRQ